jgi:hypothetical protein
MSAGSEFRSAAQRFAQQASSERRQIWPCKILLSDSTRVCVTKSATKIERAQQEQGGGWIQQARAQFNFAASLTYQPDIGGEWTVLEYADCPTEIGTRWHCIDLVRAAVGADHVATCFRLD